MKAFTRQLGILFCSVLFWYAVLYVFAAIDAQDSTFDTQLASQTLWSNEARMAAVGSFILRPSQKPTLIFIGSSNVREGFRPADLQPLFPGHTIHNLGMGASNFTQLREILTAFSPAFARLPPRKTYVVLGIWYGLFVTNADRWPEGRSDVDIERLRAGIYRQYGHQLKPDISNTIFAVRRPQRLSAAVVLMATGPAQRTGRRLIQKRNAPGCAPAYPTVDDKYRDDALAFWSRYLKHDGKLEDEQGRELVELAADVQHMGAHLILVDMPLPRWHWLRSSYYADYQARKQGFITQAHMRYGARYCSLQQLDADSSFYDSAHPFPSVVHQWSAALHDYWPAMEQP